MDNYFCYIYQEVGILLRLIVLNLKMAGSSLKLLVELGPQDIE